MQAVAIIRKLKQHFVNRDQNRFDEFVRTINGTTGLNLFKNRARENHLYLIHGARLKAIQTVLPQGKKILDIGGANSPLYEMGYPFDFDYMCMLDLPLENRHADFRKEWKHGPGRVEVRYHSMTNLDLFADSTFDFVWMGQVIEHVTLEDAEKTLREVHRVLMPGGKLALDTPNRALTLKHTAYEGVKGFIHPEHKHEFFADELETLLRKAGFTIKQKLGLCDMPLTRRTGQFTYSDFAIGNPWTQLINDAYILYFECEK